MCATGRRTSPNFTEPRTGVPRSDRAHPPLVRQQHSCPADPCPFRRLRVHDSRFTFTSPHERRQVVGGLPTRSRFTFTSPQVWKAEYGKRKTEVALTIHDSHSHPPTSFGRWSAVLPSGSRFTIHIHIPPQLVGRWSASLLMPSLPLEELFHVGVHPCHFAASEGFVNPESALWPCPMGSPICIRGSVRAPRVSLRFGPARLGSALFLLVRFLESGTVCRAEASGPVEWSWSPDRPWHPRMPSLASP